MGDIKSNIDQTRIVVEKVIKLYYEAVKNRRHLISTLYLDLENGLLSLNDNGMTRHDNKLKFVIKIPARSHSKSKLHSKPISGSGVVKQLNFKIQVTGIVICQDNSPQIFEQNFLASAQGNKWKIVSDCFKLQEPLHRKN